MRAVAQSADGATLLKRRPDIRQAERRLAAATAGIGIATGELYPDISFGATIGTVGILDNLGKPSTNRWGFGPSLSWSVPTNGARARIREAEATTQGALAHFDGVVLRLIVWNLPKRIFNATPRAIRAWRRRREPTRSLPTSLTEGRKRG